MTGRSKNGQFTKGNKAAAKKQPNSKTIVSFHSSTPDTAQPVPTDTDRIREDFIPQGVSNDWPNALAALYRKSSTHRALINSKTHYITGSNFATENERLSTFLDNSNSQESFRDVHRKLVKDKLLTGNAYWQLVYTEDGSFLNTFHIDSTKCRLSKDGKKVLINPKFSTGERVNKNDKLTKSVPIYPDFTTQGGFRVSMVHEKDYEPQFTWYGVPSYIAGIDAAAIGYKTDKWNLSRLDNSFKTSGVLILQTDMEEEEAILFDRDFDAQFTGEGNTGKVLKIRKPNGEERDGSKFIPFENVTDGDWINLHVLSNDDLVISHNWWRSLAGIATEGKLGNTQQIRDEYQLALNTIVEDEQRSWLDVYGRIFDDFGMGDENLSIINKSPIQLHEASSVIEVVEKFNREELTEDQAKFILVNNFGITQNQSTILINN